MDYSPPGSYAMEFPRQEHWSGFPSRKFPFPSKKPNTHWQSPPPLPQPWPPWICFLFPQTCLFYSFHVNRLIYDLLCLASFTYQNLSGFIQALAWICFLTFYNWIIFHCLDMPYFDIHLSVDIWLFLPLAIMGNAAVNRFLCGHLTFSWVCTLVWNLLDYMVTLFNFLGTAKLFYTQPHHFTIYESYNFSMFPPMLVIVHLFDYSIFRSVAQSCLTLCDPMNSSTPGLPVHHQLPEFTQTHVHRVSDAIQPSHSLSSPSPPAPNPSQHQGLFQWVNSSHEVAKVLVGMK